MTVAELHEILDDENKKISLKEYKEILFQLKWDVQNEICKLKKEDVTHPKLKWYYGEMNGFQLALYLSEHIEKEKEKDYYQDLYFKIVEQFQQRVKYFSEQDQDKISFAIAELEKVKEHFINIKTPTLGVIRRAEMVMYIDNQIKQLKEGN